MICALINGAVLLAQLKSDALKGDPQPLLPESSSAMTVIIGAVLVIGILAISFRPSKRDRMEK